MNPRITVKRLSWCLLPILFLGVVIAPAEEKLKHANLGDLRCDEEGSIARLEGGSWECVVDVNPNQVALLRWYEANTVTTFDVGASPRAVAFDGANVWVANFSDHTVSKLRASDGANMGTFTVGNNPIGLAFDGANVWVANFSNSTVSKL